MRLLGNALPTSREQSTALIDRAPQRSYAITELSQVMRQAKRAIASHRDTDHEVSVLLSRLRRDEARIAFRLGRPVLGVDLLEVGPGQYCERSRYFARHNQVTAIDLDTIPRSGRLGDYVRMLRINGMGRVLKTTGRKVLLVDRARRRAWERALDETNLPEPKLIFGDVCNQPLPSEAFDVVVTWSVFEHLADPGSAIDNIVQSLRPGGVFYVGIHLYTSNSGHHDIRAFTGDEASLPLWGHLRPTVEHLIHPSAYLNKLLLADWRRVFAERAPGCQEFLEDYGADRLRSVMTPALREELGEYDDSELLTVDAFYLWQKPA
jgi:SAM-dependent methyltransferase